MPMPVITVTCPRRRLFVTWRQGVSGGCARSPNATSFVEGGPGRDSDNKREEGGQSLVISKGGSVHASSLCKKCGIFGRRVNARHVGFLVMGTPKSATDTVNHVIVLRTSLPTRQSSDPGWVIGTIFKIAEIVHAEFGAN